MEIEMNPESSRGMERWNAPWFWYSILCVLCWGGWALLSKLGSREIPPETMQFLFTIGTIPVCVALLIGRRGKLEKSPRGIAFAVLNGVLSGVGGLALFILRERFQFIQVLGLLFAAAAIVIFSL